MLKNDSLFPGEQLLKERSKSGAVPFLGQVQRGDIAGAAFNGIGIQTVIISPDISVLIDQHELFRMYKIVRPAISMCYRNKEIVPGTIINFLFTAGQ